MILGLDIVLVFSSESEEYRFLFIFFAFPLDIADIPKMVVTENTAIIAITIRSSSKENP